MLVDMFSDGEGNEILELVILHPWICPFSVFPAHAASEILNVPDLCGRNEIGTALFRPRQPIPDASNADNSLVITASLCDDQKGFEMTFGTYFTS
jgi:hypothetical protein